MRERRSDAAPPGPGAGRLRHLVSPISRAQSQDPPDLPKPLRSGIHLPVNSDSQPLRVPPRLAEVPPPRRLGWWSHLLLLGIFPIVVGILSAGKAAHRGPALTRTPAGLLLVCALELGVFGVIFALAWLCSRASRDQLLLRWRPGFLALPLGAAYSVGLRLSLGLVSAVICAVLLAAGVVTQESLQQFAGANRPNVEALVDVTALRTNPLYFGLTLTLVSFVVAGMREEIWRSACLAGLRTLWPRWFGSRGGQVAAVALLAIVFGLGHLAQGAVAAGGAAFLGLGLGVIMVLHKSIWPAVIAHGFFDATSFALLPWVVDKLPRLH
jgi:membrane protease YdiL (CAAX protease family)